jgi:hypothetical protein
MTPLTNIVYLDSTLAYLIVGNPQCIFNFVIETAIFVVVCIILKHGIRIFGMLKVYYVVRRCAAFESSSGSRGMRLVWSDKRRRGIEGGLRREYICGSYRVGD